MGTLNAKADLERPLASRTGKEQLRVLALYAIYGVALAVSISIWFLAIHAPLWQDETSSYWQIIGGFSRIWSRQFLMFPAYSYVLWLSTKVIGASEIALRIPSMLAMLGAAYLLYRAAREIFHRDVAFIATIIFCLHPLSIFAAAYIRCYAFAVLATTAAIYVLLRMRHNDSNRIAALFGFLAACMLYFHYLFAAVLPALVVCYFLLKRGDRRVIWRQFGVSAVVFAVAFLPMIPGLRYVFHTSGAHVYEQAPTLTQLLSTLAPLWTSVVFIGAAVLALVIAALALEPGNSPERGEKWRVGKWRIAVCVSLAFIPLLILYGISAGTSIHMFTDRHRLVAVPGIALCWALAVGRFRAQAVRLLFTVAIVSLTAWTYYKSPTSRHPVPSWKYAIEFAQKNASVDNAPVVMCSGYIESDYAGPKLESEKDAFLSPLSYYKLSVPVVPMPYDLNSEAVEDGSRFLAEVTRKHERFLAMQNHPPYEILNWLARAASSSYEVRNRGIFDRVEVLEFDPRPK